MTTRLNERGSSRLEMVGGKGGSQRIWEAVRARRDGFTRLDIAAATGIELPSTRRYLERLQKAGFISGTQQAIGQIKQFVLVRDNGIEAPRLAPNGSLMPPTAQELMWRTMRILSEFNCHELVGHASTTDVTVVLSAAQDYLKHLHHAGYVTVVKKAGPNHLTRYRVIPSKYTGPRPPMIQRTKVVYDPNLGRVVWNEEPDHDC